MRRALITIGTFDGVHRGHRRLLRWALERSRRLGLRPEAAVFAEPPRFYFRPEARVGLLTTPARRVELLEELGFERVRVLRFGPALARTSHERFFERTILGRWKAGGLLVGRDFAFGKGRKGDLRWLGEACLREGLFLGVLPLVSSGGAKVSSSRIRELLLAGEVAKAARLLGRPHRIEGVVVRGRRLGRRLGFPTANLKVRGGLILPRGVFHARVSGGPFARARDAVLNVGVRPTFGGGRLAVEVHVPGFSGDLYGERLAVDLLRRIRAERRFATTSALRRRIAADVIRVRGGRARA